jgi:deoxyribodipyrimidine photolyase-related protein
MVTLRLILADQISESITSLEGLTKNDMVLMCEIMEKANYIPHHPKKIAFLFSIMRHFAEALRKQDINVRYVKLDDVDNTSNLTEEVKRAILELKPECIVLTEPSEYHVLSMVKEWQVIFNLPVEIRSDTRFLASHSEFERWAKGKKQLRMEFFYREMRKNMGYY